MDTNTHTGALTEQELGDAIEAAHARLWRAWDRWENMRYDQPSVLERDLACEEIDVAESLLYALESELS